MRLRSLISITIISAAVFNPAARERKANVLDIKESISDSEIVYPESFETNTRKLLESWYMKNYTATDDKYKGSDVKTTDDQIRHRLSKMPTLIEMPFNPVVRSYIDRYTQRGRAQVAAMLGLGNYYMPIFEQALEEEGLPLELKYLPVIESALDPNAVSRHGATGLWQFMLGTAKGLGMEVNSLVDERRDPYTSSKKAARYLKDLYSTYGDWSLAIAAYNCGPGSVNKALRRAGKEGTKADFWTIYNYLTPETRGYVPAFIAANYVMTYYPEHNISPVLPTKPLVTDTVGVSQRIHFNQISKVLDIPVDELRLLNPQFRADIIPGSPEKTYFLILPSQQVHAYIVSEDEIKSFEADKYAIRDYVEIGEIPSGSLLASDNKTEGETVQDEESLVASHPSPETTRVSESKVIGGKTISHKVGAGETLASIAERYSVNPADIKKWNHLRRNSVRIGQQLRIETSGKETAASQTSEPARSVGQQSQSTQTYAEPQQTYARNSWKDRKSNRKDSKNRNKNKKEKKPKTTKHEIRNGENLTVIAKKYGVTVDQLRKANNMKGDNLRAGEDLKIPASKSSKSSKKKSKKRRR